MMAMPMADVQLERGYTRIANRLDEALMVAPLTGTQQTIVRCIIRLTWGWKQRTVRISVPELADKCGKQDSGGFRRDLRELIANNVIVEVERPRGRAPAVYAVQKNFEAWRAYAVAANRLETLFGERPASLNSTPHRRTATVPDDPRRVAPEGQSIDAEFYEDFDDSVPLEGQSTYALEGQSTEKRDEPLTDPIGSSSTPYRATQGTRKSLNGETCVSPKDTKDIIPSSRIDHITGAGITDARTPIQPSAVKRFIDARRPEARPLWRAELASLEQTYSAAIVERVALECLMADDSPSTPGVFKKFCDWAVAETKPPTNGTAPSPRVAVSAAAVQEERDQHAAYDADRRQAGERWAAENAAAYAELVTQAGGELGAALNMPGGKGWAEQSAILKAADAAGFPSFGDWQWSNGSKP